MELAANALPLRLCEAELTLYAGDALSPHLTYKQVQHTEVIPAQEYE